MWQGGSHWAKMDERVSFEHCPVPTAAEKEEIELAKKTPGYDEAQAEV